MCATWHDDVRQGRQPIPKLQGAVERDTYKLIDIGEPATINGLMKELDIKDFRPHGRGRRVACPC